jgi:hypothetical protein
MLFKMSCVNPNSPEFKKALEEAGGNPLLAELIYDAKYALKEEEPTISSFTSTQKELDDLQKRINIAKREGYKIEQDNGVYSVTNSDGIQLGDNIINIEDALTVAERDYDVFVSDKAQPNTTPQDFLEDSSNIIKETEPAPIITEKTISYYGNEVTIYFQNGVPVSTSLGRREGETNVKYAQRQKAVIDFYYKLFSPTQLTIDEAIAEDEKTEDPSGNDVLAKQLQDEQIDAYQMIQNFLEKNIPLTSDKKENFYNHSFFLSGPGGSGKTFISEIVLGKKKATLAAPTHQAKGVLQRNFKGKPVKVFTAQSLLGLKPVPKKLGAEGGPDAFFSFPIEVIERAALLQNDSEKIDPTVPRMLVEDNDGIFLIDESSMINGIGSVDELNLNLKEVEHFDEDDNAYKTDLAYINPDLGVLLENYADIYYKKFGKYPKFIFTGDVAQTPPVGVASQKISELLDILRKKPSHYFELVKIRRSNNAGVRDLSMALRNEILRALEQPEGKRIPNIKKVFESVKAYSDEWENFTNIDVFLDYFLDMYEENINNFQDPEYTQYINYNTYTKENVQKLIKTIREELFEEGAENGINEGEFILLTNENTSALYNNGSKLEDIKLLKESKMFVKSIEETVHSYSFQSKKNERKTIKMPSYKITGSVKHHEKGDGKNPIDVSIFIPTEKAFEARKEAWDEIRSKGLFRVKFFDAEVSKQDLFTLFKDAVVTSIYGYVVNNYKVQGSAVKNPFVDVQNMLYGPKERDPLHIAMAIYTGISRTQNKLYTYFPGIKPQIEEGTRPTCE